MADQQYVVGLGTDDAGVHLRDAIKQLLQDDPRVAEVRDFGVPETDDDTPYPTICFEVAEAVARGELDRAVLFGGTGLGEAIAANKVRGVRAAVATDPYSIERSILSNNCQVLCLGERVVAPEAAGSIVEQWLGWTFEPNDRSSPKLALIDDYEERTGR